MDTIAYGNIQKTFKNPITGETMTSASAPGFESRAYDEPTEPAVLSTTTARPVIAKDTATISAASDIVKGVAGGPSSYQDAEGNIYSKISGSNDYTKTKSTTDVAAEALANESKTPEQIAADQAKADRQASIDATLKSYDDLALANDEATGSVLSGLKSSYEERVQQIEQINKANITILNQSGLRTGQSRYAPEMQSNVITQAEYEGQAKLQKLDTEYKNAVAAAKAALKQENYTLANKKAALILDIQNKAIEEANNRVNESAKINEDLRKQSIQASRDMAISSLISNGITDPSAILNLLNSTQDGKMVGDFTAKEVKETLGNLFPEKKADDFAGLTGDLKEFYTLKQRGLPLPSAVLALPENQQPFAYVKYKDALTKSKTAQETEKTYTFSNDERGKLIGTGLANSAIDHIQEGINQYGLQEVLNKETGLSDEQKIALSSIITQENPGDAVTVEYIDTSFDEDTLRQAANSAGYTEGGGLFTRDYGVGDDALADFKAYVIEMAAKLKKTGLKADAIRDKIDAYILDQADSY